MILILHIVSGGIIMCLSTAESKIINLCQQQCVTTMNFIKTQLHISRITVLRALKKHGYFSSYNFNSRYFTLKEIPDFDSDGLWSYGEIRFSRFGTLKKTIISLIEDSSEGLTIMELKKRLGTYVHNQLSILCKENRLGHFYAGRNVVYVSAESKRQANQIELRRLKMGGSSAALGAKRRDIKDLPEGLDILTIIKVLVQMIQTPDKNIASLAQRLQSQGVPIEAKEIEVVMNFYSLEKKTEH